MKNRNFSIVVLVMGVTGLIMFGTTQLIPQMLQQVFGYNSFQAGLALTAGGAATLAMVPFAGRLTGKVDVRLLLIPALLVQAAALWHMSHFTPDITFWDAAFARLPQAAALPFLFVPINAIAYVGLPRNKTAQASSLLNVARNLGGSFGISSAQTWLSSGVQRHQSTLVQSLNPLDPNYNDWLQQAQGAFASTGDAAGTATGVLYQTVQRQASMLAFVDDFRSLMILVLVVTPLALLLRGGKGQGGGGMAH